MVTEMRWNKNWGSLSSPLTKKTYFSFSFLGLSRYIPEEGKINRVIIIKIIIRRIYRPNVWKLSATSWQPAFQNICSSTQYTHYFATLSTKLGCERDSIGTKCQTTKTTYHWQSLNKYKYLCFRFVSCYFFFLVFLSLFPPKISVL